MNPEVEDFDRRRVDDDPSTYNLLLIGVSQSGKSTLGNFLVNDRVWAENLAPPFLMGGGIRSCTTVVQQAFVDYVHLEELADQKIIEETKVKIRIIDTPGVGDTNDSEGQAAIMHMFYQQLCKISEEKQDISCAVLVMKISTLFDAQCKKNLIFYQKLFRDLFQRNIVIVVTHMSENARGKMMYTGEGNDIAARLRSLQEEVKVTLGLHQDHNIPTIPIESICLDEPDIKNAQDARRFLFDRCRQVSGMSLSTSEFPKPPIWLEEDLILVKQLEGEKTGLLSGIDLSQGRRIECCHTCKSRMDDVEKSKTKLADLEKDLDLINNEGRVVMLEQTYSDTWHYFFRSTKHFDVSTPFAITNFAVSGGEVNYETKQIDHVKGTFRGGLWRNLHATLTLSTTNKLMYATLIRDKKHAVRDQRIILDGKRDLFDQVQTSEKEEQKLLDMLIEQLEKNKVERKKLRRDFLSIQEIKERL
jgi:hypothetical protein